MTRQRTLITLNRLCEVMNYHWQQSKWHAPVRDIAEAMDWKTMEFHGDYDRMRKAMKEHSDMQLTASRRPYVTIVLGNNVDEIIPHVIFYNAETDRFHCTSTKYIMTNNWAGKNEDIYAAVRITIDGMETDLLTAIKEPITTDEIYHVARKIFPKATRTSKYGWEYDQEITKKVNNGDLRRIQNLSGNDTASTNLLERSASTVRVLSGSSNNV